MGIIDHMPREGDVLLIRSTVASVTGRYIRVKLGNGYDIWPNAEDIYSIMETIKAGDHVETDSDIGVICGRAIFADDATILIEDEAGGRIMRAPDEVRRLPEPPPKAELPAEHEPVAPALIDAPEMEGV